ncbi:MAG: hypothetical protein ACFFER_15775, partial [Candidatus Thorarchaeota archaeon]
LVVRSPQIFAEEIRIPVAHSNLEIGSSTAYAEITIDAMGSRFEYSTSFSSGMAEIPMPFEEWGQRILGMDGPTSEYFNSEYISPLGTQGLMLWDATSESLRVSPPVVTIYVYREDPATISIDDPLAAYHNLLYVDFFYLPMEMDYDYSVGYQEKTSEEEAKFWEKNGPGIFVGAGMFICGVLSGGVGGFLLAFYGLDFMLSPFLGESLFNIGAKALMLAHTQLANALSQDWRLDLQDGVPNLDEFDNREEWLKALGDYNRRWKDGPLYSREYVESFNLFQWTTDAAVNLVFTQMFFIAFAASVGLGFSIAKGGIGAGFGSRISNLAKDWIWGPRTLTTMAKDWVRGGLTLAAIKNSLRYAGGHLSHLMGGVAFLVLFDLAHLKGTEASLLFYSMLFVSTVLSTYLLKTRVTDANGRPKVYEEGSPLFEAQDAIWTAMGESTRKACMRLGMTPLEYASLSTRAVIHALQAASYVMLLVQIALYT